VLGKISWRGIIIGGIVDVGATWILAVPFVVIYMIAAFRHVRPDQYHSIVAGMNGDSTFVTGSLVLGAAGSIIGGYVGAWLAGHDETLNGALSSWLCLLFAVAGLFIHSSQATTMLTSPGVTIALSIGLPALGGYLRLLRVRALRTAAGQGTS
jgi:hypothetical protein